MSPPRTSALSDSQLTYLTDVLGLGHLILPENRDGSGARVEMRLSTQLAQQVAGHSEDSSSVGDVGQNFGSFFRTTGDLASSRLICLFHESHLWPLEGERAEMATKMIAAMKLSSLDVYRVEWTGEMLPLELLHQLLSAGFRPVLLFGHAETVVKLDAAVKLSARAKVSAPATMESTLALVRGQFFDLDGVRVMPTYSLSELLLQPNLKKATWTHMQSVMKVML